LAAAGGEKMLQKLNNDEKRAKPGSSIGEMMITHASNSYLILSFS